MHAPTVSPCLLAADMAPSKFLLEAGAWHFRAGFLDVLCQQLVMLHHAAPTVLADCRSTLLLLSSIFTNSPRAMYSFARLWSGGRCSRATSTQRVQDW